MGIVLFHFAFIETINGSNAQVYDTHLNYVDWAETTADEHGLRRFWQHMISVDWLSCAAEPLPARALPDPSYAVVMLLL
jgi:hypothetical protein